MQLVVRLQLLFPLSFVHFWMATKELAVRMYRAATPPLTDEPFQAPDPFKDAPESLLTWGDHVERSE